MKLYYTKMSFSDEFVSPWTSVSSDILEKYDLAVEHLEKIKAELLKVETTKRKCEYLIAIVEIKNKYSNCPITCKKVLDSMDQSYKNKYNEILKKYEIADEEVTKLKSMITNKEESFYYI